MLTPTLTSILTPTLVSGSHGKTILVTDTADSGPGTLRQALLEARSGETIIFDPAVFPPDASATIYLTSSLPPITQGNLTVDGSNAGVILDGSGISEWVAALDILSDGNIVQGLQVVNFLGAGIVLSGGAQGNTVGGNRSIGSGPLGQGNLINNGGTGIGLWGEGTSFNTITGNLIGTDVTGKEAFSNDFGISIVEEASRNIIGPNNVIAYNRRDGVEIHDHNSVGNTITQNCIHDNEGGGIKLWDGSNAELSAPLIFDFDMDSGIVTGAASANCAVEIFSDDSDEGEVYEGRTMADSLGVFTFNKGTSFTGTHLTATATDADGDTSEFSAPTSGMLRYTAIQEINDLPKTLLTHKQSKELLDNHMGDFIALPDETTWPRDYDKRINKFGYKWVYLTIDYFDFSEVLESGGYSEFIIDPEQDKLMTDLVNNDITIIYNLVYYEPVEIDTPFDWMNLEPYSIKDPNKEGRFRTEEEIQRYLDYVSFLVRQFKDRIKYYQILNEINNGIIGQYIRSEDYINLVKRVIPVIRDECPDAKILVGSVLGLPNELGCIPSEPTTYEYLFDILNSDIMPLVDGITFHPSPELSPEYDAACYTGVQCDDISEGYYEYYQETIQEIKDVATFNGFKGEYITEGPTFNTYTLPPQTLYYSDLIAAKYNSRSVIMHLNKNVTVILPSGGPSIIQLKRATQNLCNIMEGANPLSLQIEIQSDAKNIKSCSFSLPDGDTLIALWTDGVAAEEDPGVRANLTCQGLTVHDVVGIDVLVGFQQSILTSNGNEDLVIQNLIVRDYPLILRLTPSPEVTLSISISLSANTINIGESVTISGLISPPISGAMVHLTYWKTGEAEAVRTVTATLDGSFSDTYMPDAAGSWSVEASWEGNVKYAGATSQTLVFTVVEPPKTGSLKIIVQDENENRTSGATVSSTSQPRDQQALVGSSETDGSVTFVDVKIGDYTIQASRSGYDADSKSVTVIEGETTTLVIQLKEQVGTLKVFIKDKNGDPVSGTAVSSINQPSGQSSLSSTTGSDGSVIFIDVKLGNYTFQASKSGYETKSVSVNVEAVETTEIHITLEKEKPMGGIPGFPYGSIIIGLFLGVLVVARSYGKRLRSHKGQSGIHVSLVLMMVYAVAIAAYHLGRPELRQSVAFFA